jgi:hypothetical protein
MPKADRAATEARKFVERKSHVTKEGREVLYKLDWKRRVIELRERCGGRCEYVIHGIGEVTADGGLRCSREAADPHHIKLRSRGRDDRLSNLLAVCRHHHQILDAEQRRERLKR